MQATLETLTTELIGLPKRERLEIVRFLLFLDNCSQDTHQIDLAWETEINDRMQAVDSGTAVGLDYTEVMQKLTQRFAL